MRPDVPTVAVDSFVGRDADVRELRDAIARSRLVTVTGTGGIGKSRLAREVSTLVVDKYVDGCRTVSLSVVRSDDDVSERVVDALLPSPVAAGAPDEQLAQYLADKQLLLVVDSCEHLLPGCRRLFASLLTAAPGLRIVATSREPLTIAGERVVTLPPLSTPDPSLSSSSSPTVADVRRYGAVRLLEDRAVAVQGQFRLDGSNAAAVAQLAARLDGLPLAIELAASRLRSLSVFELTDRLDDRFAMLTGGDPTARTRHRTLRAMVEWSWELCSPGEQRLWAALPVFSGGADLEAISAVAGEADQPDVLDVLDGLVAKSVVSANTTMRRGRYTTIETMVAFGRERTAEFFPDPDELAGRHARYYLSLAERARDGFFTVDQLDWTQRLRQERANLAAAFDFLLRTDPPAALRLATALRFHWLTGPLREGERWLDDALAATAEPDVGRLEALFASSWVAVGQGDCARATRRAAEATELAAALGRPEWTKRARVFAAIAAQLCGELDVAEREFTSLIEVLAMPEDLEHLLLAVSLQVLNCLQLGQVARADRYFTMLTELCDDCGERWIKSYGQAFYAFEAWVHDDVDAAGRAAADSLRVKLEFDDVMGSAMLIGVLAAVAYRRGDLERAAELLGHTAVVNRGIGVTAAAYGVTTHEALTGILGDLRRTLGDVTFEQAFARGGHLSAADLARLSTPDDEPIVDNGSRLLSDREHQVATLVSQGLSNRQIAERLVLSPRTIDGHLERIFGKLAVRSRAAVSAWVVTHPRR